MPLVVRHVRMGGYVLHRGLVRVFQGLLVHRVKPASLDFLVKSARRVPLIVKYVTMVSMDLDYASNLKA